MEKKIRNSNIELLRIIAMLAIVSTHYLYSGFKGLEFYNYNTYLIQVFKIGGVLGVDIFFIISGYYMYKSKMTARKVLKLEGEVLFYSIIGIILCSGILKIFKIYDIKELLRYIMPTLNNTYWFFTTYILLMILSKYINKFIDSLEMKSFKTLMIILFVIDFVIPTYLKIATDLIFISRSCTLYLIGAYIRKYNIANSKNRAKYNKKIGLYFIIQTIITVTSVYIWHVTDKYIMRDVDFFVVHANPIIALIAIYMFLSFISLPPKENKLINTISSTVFGVYLIHEHPMIRPVIWAMIIDCKQYLDKPYMLINCIISTAIIFVFCGAIDFVRTNTIEKLYMKCVDKVIDKVQRRKKLKITDGS